MSIVQISKIQQRSGDLVDLPQLDEAELGFASDVGRLFVGKTSGNVQNIEVLTAYSEIAFDQIEGANSNLAIDATILDDGQVLVYDGDINAWTNRGGNAGGNINLGHVSNVFIGGGGIDYVLTTDGTGNLSWTPKSTIVEYIKNVSQANPGVVTTTEPHFLTNGAEITITGVQGMTQLNGESYFIGNLTTNTFALYDDVTLTTSVNTSGFTTFPYTTATGTTQLGNIITVANGSPFSANMTVTFNGNTGNSLLVANATYYVLTANSTSLTVSNTSGGNAIPLANTSGLTLEVYATGGKLTSAVGGSEGTANAGGANTNIQFNYNNLLYGSPNLTYNFTNSYLVLNGTANIGNLIVGNLTANAGNFTTLTANTGNFVDINVSNNSNLTNLNVSNLANLGAIGNLRIAGGTSGEVLTTYGNGVVYWGAGGGGGGGGWPGYYLHNQTSSSTTWTVVHNLNTQYVDVTPIFSNANSITGHYDYPNVTYINANAVTLTFNSAITGYAAIVGDSGNSAGYYLHNQVVSTTTWTVNHNLGSQFVAVTPITPADLSYVGRYDFPSVVYNNANSCTVTFSTAQTGKVAIVGSSNIDGYYLHTQASASSTWVVNHNLGSQYLSVTPIDSANTSYVGRYDYPTITYNNVNALTLTFNSAVTGYVVVAGGNGDSYAAGGANTEVQFNDGGTLNGDPTFAFNKITKVVNIGNLSTTLITTGSSATAGNITGNWTLTSGSRLQSTYADLAEYYSADKAYVPGTLLEFGGNKEVTIAGIESNKLAGVVSSEPSYVMNGDIQTQYPVMIALVGRVPVKVKGVVNKGDMLVSAGEGFAKASIVSPKIGTVIGKAIENKTDTGEGMVEVMVGRL